MGLPRSTFCERRRRPLCPRLPARRGPKTRYSDEELLAEILRTVQESPFHGEGHRKVWARLRVREVRSSMRRVLRLMRDNGLLAPQRQPQPVELKRHDGTILAERPNQMRDIDATVGFTVDEGRVTIFAMVDHATAECLGIHFPLQGAGPEVPGQFPGPRSFAPRTNSGFQETGKGARGILPVAQRFRIAGQNPISIRDGGRARTIFGPANPP